MSVTFGSGRDRTTLPTPHVVIEEERVAKKDKRTAFQGIPIVLDRPKGFVHEGKDPKGKPWKRVYRFDYGYIPKTEGGDDEDTDVFIGSSATAPIAYWAVQMKDDGNFDEFKVFLGFTSFALARACYNIHIPPRFCAGFFRVPVAAMKSILGLMPEPLLQGLEKRMRNRLIKLAGVSFDVLQSSLSEALRNAFPAQEDGCAVSCYPIEVYDDSVIYSHDGKMFRDGYTFANGAATLAGSPVAVMRTYVPVDQAQGGAPAGEVAMNQQKMKKDTGAGDIVGLAAERLSTLAGELGKGDGKITPDMASELDAVMALLEVARNAYTGPAADAGAGGEEEEGADLELEMADLADAEKNGGVVKMNADQIVSYATKRLAKVRAEKDPVRAAVKASHLETMLLTAVALMKSKGADEQIPVVIMADGDDANAKVETPEGATISNVIGQGAGAPAAAAGDVEPPANAPAPAPTEKNAKLAKATEEIAKLRAKMGGRTNVAKNEPAPAAGAGSTPAGGGEVFSAAYIDGLPDEAFLYVEDGVMPVDGQTPKTARHFPVRDATGALSPPMLQKALASVDAWGATTTVKAMVVERAKSLEAYATASAKSDQQAPTRGDAGWPSDLSPANPAAPPPAANAYGFDDIPGKIAARAGT